MNRIIASLMSLVCLVACDPPLSTKPFETVANQTEKAPRYAITDLGTLGGTFSFSRGMNERGAVIGNSTKANGASPRRRAERRVLHQQ